MTTTPPPARRIHTPPTPLHGSKFDSYEPYSPRRSNRVAAKQYNHRGSFQHNGAVDINSYTPGRFPRASTPSNLSVKTSSQTISPPSSPGTPSPQHYFSKTPKSTSRRSITGSSIKHNKGTQLHADSDADDFGPSSSDIKPTSASSLGMLPTPSKTPRKKDIAQHGSLSAARVLFPDRLANIEDAMPSTRKSRKKRVTAFSLSDVSSDIDDGNSSKIPIYTDSKERVPDLDNDDKNPFVTRKSSRTKPATNGENFLKRKKPSRRDEAMEEAVRNDEGIIYVFRGKKMFRRFDQGPPDASHIEQEADTADPSTTNTTPTTSPLNRALHRAAGGAASRPFTRSSIKPRLLFPNEEQRRQREEQEADEEEAVTDIDVPQPTRRQPTGLGLHVTAGEGLDAEAREEELVTPVKERFKPATPPSTERTTRSTNKGTAEVSAGEMLTQGTTGRAEDELARMRMPQMRKPKPSPFASWQRVKPGAAQRMVSKGVKREGEVLESEGKRTRSGAHAESSGT
ncbi:hypothetical protein LTS18_012962 [Coniosporium uncinatum]|uniref:Uncharacterized protein n=1 Tax=Coniosporium uncinatum TaxID=93489 RepID=A0ACC3DVG1_9PEZI|nr:hypothetical protein LTS18_012962 [Coniosporium uncinatum]